jgi:hypothetical protein
MSKKPKSVKRIKIAGHWYKVQYKDNLARDNDAAGRSNANKLTIDLDPTGATSHKQEILIHEIVEQLNYRFELGMPHGTISSISAGLYQVLTDNPGILEGIK